VQTISEFSHWAWGAVKAVSSGICAARTGFQPRKEERVRIGHRRERMLAMQPMGLTMMTDIQTFALWRHFYSLHAISFRIMFPSDKKTNNFSPVLRHQWITTQRAFFEQSIQESFFLSHKLKCLRGTWLISQFGILECYSSICYAYDEDYDKLFYGRHIQVVKYLIPNNPNHQVM